jgi:GntR family transcriptional regulator/MocR family aminotransferase
MDAGMHVLWRLPEDTDETAALDTCRTAGLTVLGLSRCRVAPGAAGLVLGYGNVAPHRAPAVAALLADAVAAARRTVAAGTLTQ